jgi:C4-dicarboxylate-binding protein DctP
MKLAAFLLMVMVAGLALPDRAHGAQSIVIRFSHVVAPDTPKGKGAEQFKLLAEELSKGRVKVELYPSSRLYGDLDEMEALLRGWVEMLAPSLSKFRVLRLREFELFDLPYLFPDREALYRVMDGEVGKGLLARLEPKGILGLAYWDNGFKQMSANKPLRKADDIKGLKMRVQPSKVLEVQMRALGAQPRVIPFAEVYASLRSGAVDGTENPLSNFYTQRMHQVQKHLTISDHGYLGYAVIVNKKFWQGLPPDIRSALEQAMAETTRFERENAQRYNDDALAAVKKAGTTEIHVLSGEERQAWQRALLPVHKKFEREVGPESLKAVREAVGRR